MPKSISIFFDAVESAIHVGAVLFRFFANYQKALNVYDWKIILASNWKKLLYFTFVNSRKVEKRKEEESSFGGRSKIITQRMRHKKDTLEVAWSRIPTFIWWPERDQRIKTTSFLLSLLYSISLFWSSISSLTKMTLILHKSSILLIECCINYNISYYSYQVPVCFKKFLHVSETIVTVFWSHIIYF